MIDYETIARSLHYQGNNCSKAIHDAYKYDLHLDENYPKPRSRDGECGAVLVTEYILKERGREDLVESYQTIFKEKYGSFKCKELTGDREKCNDYIGFSASYLIDKVWNKKES
jgi:hypothetical protein